MTTKVAFCYDFYLIKPTFDQNCTLNGRKVDVQEKTFFSCK